MIAGHYRTRHEINITNYDWKQNKEMQLNTTPCVDLNKKKTIYRMKADMER